MGEDWSVAAAGSSSAYAVVAATAAAEVASINRTGEHRPFHAAVTTAVAAGGFQVITEARWRVPAIMGTCRTHR